MRADSVAGSSSASSVSGLPSASTITKSSNSSNLRKSTGFLSSGRKLLILLHRLGGHTMCVAFDWTRPRATCAWYSNRYSINIHLVWKRAHAQNVNNYCLLHNVLFPLSTHSCCTSVFIGKQTQLNWPPSFEHQHYTDIQLVSFNSQTSSPHVDDCMRDIMQEGNWGKRWTGVGEGLG